ncbi:MAG TPA: IPT/TIG domain-containing protein [Bryobacteraceae bacterium]|nr:IPT/TIG domain-containing protein [Bryobacteraceae bacterium]
MTANVQPQRNGNIFINGQAVPISQAAGQPVAPQISSLSPPSGPVGTYVVIWGTYYGSTLTNTTVTFNGIPVSSYDYGITTIGARVPAGTTTGPVIVTVAGLPSNPLTFTVIPTPVINSLSTTSGPVGTAVTISGSLFGVNQTTSTVTFNGITAQVRGWSDSTITAVVPPGATTGPVMVTVGGVGGSGPAFSVTGASPYISGLSPGSGNVGTAVTISGSKFGSSQGTVTFNGVAAAVSNWTTSSIVAAVPPGSATGPVVVTVSGVGSNSVQYAVTGPTPSIVSVSPNPAAPAGSVTVTGSGFGANQVNGKVWLGTSFGAVTSWSDTQIVATVAANATSGTAQVQQSGMWSNSVPFTVNTAQIASITPNSGIAGTLVTITGSGFGSAQGSGQVWLGTAAASVQSWSDTQVVATVSAGAASGNAQVLQNGVMSNSVPFTINIPHLLSVTPGSGLPGTSVTITGTGFGSTQGSGAVWLGSTTGQVTSWSDTQVMASVASGAVTGIARVQQNGVWSNAMAFIVPSGDNMSLTPNLLNLVVGDTHSVAAVSSTGQAVTGLTWTSSDPTIVSLSTDDPPVLTAVAAGRATITAGTASADVTVFSNDLPVGTVQWSNAGDGSGVDRIVPAVPNANGVADVFAFQQDGTVQAITSDGATAWQLDATQIRSLIPDFQGGLVGLEQTDSTNGNLCALVQFNGLTGQKTTVYSPVDCYPSAVVSTDGTIFARRMPADNGYEYTDFTIVGVNPLTGNQFTVLMAQGANTTPLDGQYGDFIIAGDGYLYIPGCTRSLARTSTTRFSTTGSSG